MKKAVLFVVLFIYAESIWADVGDQYVLPKFGIMVINFRDVDTRYDYDVGMIFTLGVLYGYGITQQISLEGEFNTGQKGGAYDIDYEQGEYKITTLAGFGVYRFAFVDTAYVKGKLGLLAEYIVRTSNLPDLEGADPALDYGIAGGVGAGVIISGALTLEAEITAIDRDVIFYNLGVHYPF